MFICLGVTCGFITKSFALERIQIMPPNRF